jgi:hypothetical protein
MIETTFKYVAIGHKFDHQDTTYTKTNHMRGFRQGTTKQTEYRNFNNKAKVTAHVDYYRQGSI